VRIGIIPQGGKDWIAGVIYLQNLVRGLHLLPEEEKPSLYFILRSGTTIEDYQDLGRLIPASKYYTFRAGNSLRIKIRNTMKDAVWSHWPVSLEQLTRRLRLSALFPLHSSLGRGFFSPWIGWIPDFQHKRLPQYFSQEESRNRDESFQRIVDEASHVVVSSQDAYRDLMRWFPISPQRSSVLPFVSVPVQEWFDGNPQEIINKFGLPKKYLALPSQFWIHKNHKCVFEAIRILKNRSRSEIALVCTGRMHDYRHPHYGEDLLTYLKTYGLERNVYCLGLLGRNTQIQILRGALAIIQPSFFEGWSSLVEDARALGKNIYVSDIPIHREQEPPNAQFFNPESPEELATLIAKDWDQLSPGPTRAQEEEAFVVQKTRAVNFARDFVKITMKACNLC
jgi:Glycosyl transferases group 1